MKNILIIAIILIAIAQIFNGHIYGIYNYPYGTILDGSTGYVRKINGVWYVINVNGGMGYGYRKEILLHEFNNMDLLGPVFKTRERDVMRNRGYVFVDPIDVYKILTKE